MIEIGQTIGNYVVTSKLGEGGMGIVYLVEHPVIGRKAALKAIHPQFARSAEIVSRFVTEATVVNQIGHANIVDVTDFGTTPAKDFYFIMQHLDGDSLAERIQKEVHLPPARALRVTAQIADALQASHDHGVIHRDLKPDNIFLITKGDDGDFVKVLDFGLAKLVGMEGTPSHNTQTGSVMGTPFYMAPEQCEGKGDVDHRADIYALGVVLFEMLTGKVPFGGTGYGEVILKQMTLRAPAARSLIPELPPALDAILARALAKNPADRFQSMAEFQAAVLDPEAFAASLPHVEPTDSLSGRFRAAAPAARSEMGLRPTIVSSPRATSNPRLGMSTLREGAGEVEESRVAVPRRRGRRGIGVALAACLVLMLLPATYQHPAARVVAVAQALSRPSTVRLNFSSDPAGATVVRKDGVVVGVTPLSIEAPYGDVATEFVFRKEGFLPKTFALVPNLPSPIFAVLESADLPDPPLPLMAVASRAVHRSHSRHGHAGAVVVAPVVEADVESVDGDETLAPSAE